MCCITSDNDENEKGFILMRDEIYRELCLAVNTLPGRCREVFELHLQGKRDEEIAELLSLSVLTVKTHKKDAIRILRVKLGKWFAWLILMKVI